MFEWRNWAGNQRCTPASVASPSTVEQVVEVVLAARAAGLRVKAAGAGHSFTPIAATDGIHVRLDHLSGIVDESDGLVTLFAGTRLWEIPRLLSRYGLAMTNLGDIDRQTISGAISTGTHGTGARFGGISTQVRALTLVLADGSVVSCSAEDRPELFAAARIGLGAMGIIATVTLECEPAFLLRAVEKPVRFEEILSAFDSWSDEHDYTEFHWFPHTKWTLYKQNDRLPHGTLRQPLSKLKSYVDDELLSNTTFGALCYLGRQLPPLIPGINQISARALGAREYIDDSHRVFASPRRVRFREMEYGVPREALVNVLREIRALIKRRGLRISFPIQVRLAAADDIWMSTAYQRDTAYIAVHTFYRERHTEYFRGVEEIMSAAGGRPHWGKIHYLTSVDLSKRYPRFGDFVALREELDPERCFDNSYLGRVLG